MNRLEVTAWEWPEITAGTDLAALVCACPDLTDQDVVVVTSKVISKAEGLVTAGDRSDLIESQTVRVVARRGDAVIAETAHGLVMAAAGVDASNVAAGQALSLPGDPDAWAGKLREQVYARLGINVGVVVSDTAGRAWRLGQTDIAIGCAGLPPLVDLAGTRDTHGNVLQVTAPAVADELAAACDLVKTKTSGRPLAVVRGLGGLVLAVGVHGSGAAALARPAVNDLFGLGARDAVVAAALRDDEVALAHFPRRLASDRPPFDSLVSTRPAIRLLVERVTSDPGSADGWVVQIDVHDHAEGADWVEVGRLQERIETLAAAHRLRADCTATHDRLTGGWRTESRTGWLAT